METTKTDLITRLKERIQSQKYSLPTIPEASLRVMKLLSDPKSSPGEMEKVIGMDPVLAGQILKIANSCVYGARAEITSLKMAIVRMGRKQLRSIILMMSTKSSLIKGDILGPTQEMWRHSVASAFLSRDIGKKAKLEAEELFIIALLHNIGKLMILSLLNELQRLSSVKAPFDPELLELVFEAHHLDIAKKVLAAWKIPDKIREIIAMQNVVQKTSVNGNESERSVLVLRFADELATMLINDEVEEAPLQERGKSLGISEKQVVDILQTSRQSFEEISQFV